MDKYRFDVKLKVVQAYFSGEEGYGFITKNMKLHLKAT